MIGGVGMNVKIDITNGVICQQNFGGRHYEKNLFQYFTVDEIDVNMLACNSIKEQCKLIHGVVLEDNEEYIRIYNDPFCSHPVYIVRVGSDKLVISTQFNDVYQCDAALSVDKVGTYELLWIGQVLYDRTIFNEVKQLPAASYCEIKKATMNYQIFPYWNYDIYENKEIDTQDKAVEVVYEQLKNIYDEYRGKNIVMGLSGGLDSRLSACLLSERIDKNQSIFFTFGYNKHILEYTFAKKVSKKLSLPEPIFIKLNEMDYANAKELAKWTGCHVGMNHGHTYTSLGHVDSNKDMTYVSNYYSDAVMGWDAKKEKRIEKLEDLEIYKKLCINQDKLPYEVADKIVADEIEDLKKIVKRWNVESNFSCFEEFFYVVERNTKFHLRSAYQCNDIFRTDVPFANFHLLTLCISIPLEYRWEKKIEGEIISRYYIDENDVSSRRYFERSKQSEKEYSLMEKAYYYSGMLFLRGLNLLNLILAKVSNNYIQVINPYQTENQRVIFDKYFKQDFLEKLDEIANRGLISGGACLEIKKNHFRSSNIWQKFTIISLGVCLDNMENKRKGL